MVWLYRQFTFFGDSGSRSSLRLEKRGTGVGMSTNLNITPKYVKSLFAFFVFEFIAATGINNRLTLNLQGKKWIQIMTVL